MHAFAGFGNRAVVLIAAIAALAVAQPAAAGLVLTDPGSELYYTLAVTAGDEVKIDKFCTVTGDVHSNKKVSLETDGVVEGDVSASVEADIKGTVTGTVSSPVPARTLPVLLDEAQARALAGQVYEGDHDFVDATVDGVVFVDGKARFLGSIGGVGTVIASGDIEVKEVPLGSGPGLLAPGTRLSLIAFKSLKLEKARAMRGALYAGTDVILQKNTTFEGTAVAQGKVDVQEGTQATFLNVDPVAPSLSLRPPGAPTVYSQPGLQALIEYGDNLSGVDLTTLLFILDGGDLTASCAVAPAVAICALDDLAAGSHQIGASVVDVAGNPATAAAAFEVLVDDGAPEVAITAPAGTTENPRPEIVVTYADAVSGIDLDNLRIVLDGLDLAPICDRGELVATCDPPEDLAAAEHLLEVAVQDLAGNAASATASFQVAADPDPPTLTLVNPAPGATEILGHPTPVRADYDDDGSGIDRADVSVTLDAQPAEPCLIGYRSLACRLEGLVAGEHQVVVSLADRAGNPASVQRSFLVVADDAPPSVEVLDPPPGALVDTSQILVSGTATDDDQVAAVTVDGVPASLAGDAFQAVVDLAEGVNRVRVEAVDRAGRRASAELQVTLDTEPPTLAVVQPADGVATHAAMVRVVAEAGDGSGIDRVEVAGTLATAVGGRYEAAVPLSEGANLLPVRAVDAAGNTTETQVGIERITLPEAAITAPVDYAVIAATTVTVSGTVSDSLAAVTVNGIAAQVDGDGFVAAGVPLIEGGNLITATVLAADGRVATDSVSVVRDLTPPHLAVRYPRDGAVVSEASVDVLGMVNDIVAGTVNASEAQVTVAGLPAEVANRTFRLEDLPLVEGDNVIEIEARDQGGNVARTELRVERRIPNAGRLRLVSGNQQQDVVGSQVAAPLVVRLEDAAGDPIGGETVLFKVTSGGGELLPAGRTLAAETTAADGTAAIHLRLGSWAGVATQVVEARSVGYGGPVVFTFDALPSDPAHIVVDAGGEQEGIAGRTLPRPLVVVVTDAGHNRLQGVPVVFRVVLGGGSVGDGQPEAEIVTDSDGRAIVPFRLGELPGVAAHVVEAAIVGREDVEVASFTATARIAGDPADTSISGVVLDNTNQPVPGVTVRIPGTQVVEQAGADGTFRIAGAPVGTLKLIVDGSTATRAGTWPDLELTLTTIPGQDNTVGMPIYLLPLDLGSGVYVSETEGGALSLPGVPGFELDIAPGSVTFPGGSKSGLVSVTTVHADRIPMVPNFGQQPRLIVTIQPAGARFDPPARLTLPNVEGLAPGQVTEFYSFDHDLGHFVSIGPATVSEDGLEIVSNPGVGIIKAGWHCGGDPATTGTAHDCPDCNRCVNNRCEPEADQTSCSDDGDACTMDVCVGGACTHPQVECDECKKCDGGNCVTDTAQEDQPCTDDGDNCTKDVCQNGNCDHLQKMVDSVEFELSNPIRTGLPWSLRGDAQPAQLASMVNTTNCDPANVQYEWDFGDGNMSTMGPNTSHTYALTGEYDVKLTAKCDSCDASAKDVTHQVTVGFLATCYIIASENDYGAPYVTNPNGLTGTYSESFLRAVRMQGSGESTGGQYIQIDFNRGNYQASFATTYFTVVTTIQTASGQPLTATTIAVDDAIIPLGSNVNVVGLGVRDADDTGDRITGYHIDVFGGAGRAACAGWTNPVYPIQGY